MPSFQTDSNLDRRIKKKLITDTIALLNMSTNRRARMKNQKVFDMNKRLMNKFNVVPSSK